VTAVFTENWFGVAAQVTLGSLVKSVDHVPGRIVEIGAWEGRSTIAMANATTRIVHSVDTWKGSPSDVSHELADERDVFQRYMANIKAATKGNVVPHRMDWRDYRDTDDSTVALLFIDAEHTYDEVYDNIQAFLPIMAPGGIMCGDDATHPPVWSAVTNSFPEAAYAGVVWVARL
jgi:predicted O-methyltransferase YrrM